MIQHKTWNNSNHGVVRETICRQRLGATALLAYMVESGILKKLKVREAIVSFEIKGSHRRLGASHRTTGSEKRQTITKKSRSITERKTMSWKLWKGALVSRLIKSKVEKCRKACQAVLDGIDLLKPSDLILASCQKVCDSVQRLLFEHHKRAFPVMPVLLLYRLKDSWWQNCLVTIPSPMIDGRPNQLELVTKWCCESAGSERPRSYGRKVGSWLGLGYETWTENYYALFILYTISTLFAILTSKIFGEKVVDIIDQTWRLSETNFGNFRKPDFCTFESSKTSPTSKTIDSIP